MAFSVQDDSGNVSDANAYIDVNFFKEYHKDRGRNVNDVGSGNAVFEGAIVVATDYADTRFKFVGEKPNRTQTTKWPRFNAIDKDGRLETGIPLVVKQAVAEYAYAHREFIDTGGLFPNPTYDATGRMVDKSRVKVDVIEEEIVYSKASGQSVRVIPAGDARIKSTGLVVMGNLIRLG